MGLTMRLKKLISFGLIFWGLLTKTGFSWAGSNEDWVDKTLSKMDLREKIGQMIVATAFARFINEDSDEWYGIQHTIKKYKVGGYHLYFGDIYSAAQLTNKMQALSDIPLLIDADFETGVGHRFPGATEFPSNMAIGATGSEYYAFKMGEITAREARAIGIHLTYAPVMDVNNNPNNPIINTRSYGEDPMLVARLGTAFIRGCHAGGLLTTAKHFPGHGNTSVDSHTDLPLIPSDLNQLSRLELVPFKRAIDAGVDLIMTAHIVLPQLTRETFQPATLSFDVLNRLLRKRLNFQGLIVTDALEMGAIKNNFTEKYTVVQAVKAGADILLAPQNIPLVIRTIEEKVKKGEISETRINQSVRKILSFKAKLGLHKNRFVDIAEISKIVGSPGFKSLAMKMANDAVTLVKNERHLIPWPYDKNLTPVVLNIYDETPSGDQVFAAEVKKRFEMTQAYTIGDFSDSRSLEQMAHNLDTTHVILAALYVNIKSGKGRANLPEQVTEFLKNLHRQGYPVVAISFGNPYVFTQIPEVDAYLCAYGRQENLQKAAAQALFGEIDIRGKLPVTIPGYYPRGHGLEINKVRKHPLIVKVPHAPRLQYSLPEEAGFDPKKLSKIDTVITQAIADSAFPGAVVLVARKGKIALEKAYGKFTYQPDAPVMKTNAIFDLASVTKVVATTTAAMILFDRGEIALDDPVVQYIPQFTGGLRDSITIRHLLTHSSGLPPFKRFFLQYTSPEEIWQAIYETEITFPPGTKTVYSDIGMILLGKIIEMVSGKPLDEFCRQEIFTPLGMQDTFFNPPDSLKYRIVPTEIDPWRGRLVHGEVHDENAYALGGVAGHAGLFSTAKDLAIFLQMLLNGGMYDTVRLIKEQTVRLFTRRQNLVPGSSRALGWDTPSQPSSSGHYFSPESFGHTGFTGTSVWVDPNRKLLVVFLTNRVHPTRKNIKIRKVRVQLHDAVIKALSGE